ncbi:MAG: hypothetical protein A3K68_01795 [Euryarchaeota archaeon RBG_16_68_13]|nr:MAG: hypothetical protein A3K68_01795 [Euryarchaeota archaeon RBG_16_68_13]
MKLLVVTEGGEVADPPAVVEHIHEAARQVSALHEHGSRAQAPDRTRRPLGLVQPRDADPREPLRLMPVRRDEVRAREEPVHERVPEVVPFQGGSDGRDHDRIHDEREARLREFLRDGADDLRGIQHPGLRCPDLEVPEDGPELAADLDRRDRED